MTTMLERVTMAYRQLATTGKAISHHPELAGRVHLYSNLNSAVNQQMNDFADYGSVYEVYAWVRKAVSVISENVSALPVIVVDKDEQGIDAHPLTELMAYGNDTQTGSDIWALWCVHMLLGGEGPIEFVPDSRGRPVEMWNRRPDFVSIIPDLSREEFPSVFEYRYSELAGGKDGRAIPLDAMLFTKFPNPLNKWRGLAPITAVREGVTIDLFAQNWSKLFLKNNARPDFAIVAPQGITPTEKERYLADFLRKGQGNPHLPVVLEDGVTDIKTFSFAPKDIEWLEQRRFSRDEVGAVFGVPDEIMGYGKDTYENFQTALEVLWTLTIVPLVRRRDEALNKHFRRASGVLRPGEKIQTDLSGVDVLNEDLLPKVEMAGKLWALGVPWNVIDERLNLGFGEIPGGEVGYVPSSFVPVGQEQRARQDEVRRFRAWAGKRKNPDPSDFKSEILSKADKAALLAEVTQEQENFIYSETEKRAMIEAAARIVSRGG